MIHENLIGMTILFILIIASYYFLNGILIFGINYISFRAKSSISIKILYLFISIILLSAFIFIASYMTFLMLSIVVKQGMAAINFKISFIHMLILAVILCVILMILYISMCNFINKNLYIFFYDVQAEDKCESEVGNRLISSRYLKNKILIKDLIEFHRRKSMLKIIGFIVQGLAFGFMCYIYLEDQTNIYNFINSIPIINLIILFQIIPITLIYILISYQNIKVKDELSSLKQFSIKVNIKYIIIGKSNYLFSISIAPLLIGMTILFFRNISIRFFIEMIYIILPITFFAKFLSIFTIKFILMKEKLKEFKLIILFIVIVFNTAILIFTMNPDNTIILKNVYNIIFILFNIILYYTEVLGLIIFRKWWESAEN
ncbi:hypothetical protein [Clostridium pasteurianum]|nr:hypothetical protein [Clostridium pasteurianum]